MCNGHQLKRHLESSLNSPLTLPLRTGTPQTVTITGVDDDVIDGDQSTTITVSVVDALSDDDFDSLNDQTVASVTPTMTKPVSQ